MPVLRKIFFLFCVMFFFYLTSIKKNKKFKKVPSLPSHLLTSPHHNGVEEVSLPATKPSPHPLLDAKWGV